MNRAVTKQPSEVCGHDSGHFRPVIDASRCEGKAACVSVCPYTVFEIGRMDDERFNAMPLLVKLKLWAHGRKTASTPRADACHACGLCVAACPEKAIRLVPTGVAGPAIIR
jgi:NAD-dependent dihydropyrimidine dehydrogenase PreA subunit